MREGTWIASLEVWDDSVAVRWAQQAPPKSERYIEYSDDYLPWHPTALERKRWSLVDDAGNTYEVTNAGASGANEWFRGHVVFSPAPSSAARTLRIALADEEVTVSLDE